MTGTDRSKWNTKYLNGPSVHPPMPDWLRQHLALLPKGDSLDLATGLGAVPIELARRGWRSTGVDISDVALRRARALATNLGAHVNWLVADITDYPLPPKRFDLITAFYYLDRRYFQTHVVQSLRPGGMLILETFSIEQLQIPDSHIRNPAYLLTPGELLQLFPSLRTRAYREIKFSDRAVASLVAQNCECY